MNLRSRARALVMHTAAFVRADELAIRIQQSKRRSSGLVVGLHETPRLLQKQFREQLEWVSRHFTITDLEGFATLWNDPKKSRAFAKPPVLFTFDDGRENNYDVAAPMLESFGGRGVFFIVPGFAESAGPNALAFYRSRINPDSIAGDEVLGDWKPMSPAQVADLAARGHAIGNHTLTHQRLVGLSLAQLEHEIGDGARKLESWTKKPVDAFAWTFDWNAMDANAWKVVRRYHRFCFSPCPGAIDSCKDSPALLWRREIEAKCAAPEYRSLYAGLVDPWWSTRRRRLRKLLDLSYARPAA